MYGSIQDRIAPTHHSPDIEKRIVVSLVLRHSFYASLLHVESSSKPLDFGVQALSLHEHFPRYCASLGIRAIAHSIFFYIMIVRLAESHL